MQTAAHMFVFARFHTRRSTRTLNVVGSSDGRWKQPMMNVAACAGLAVEASAPTATPSTSNALAIRWQRRPDVESAFLAVVLSSVTMNARRPGRPSEKRCRMGDLLVTQEWLVDLAAQTGGTSPWVDFEVGR